MLGWFGTLTPAVVARVDRVWCTKQCSGRYVEQKIIIVIIVEGCQRVMREDGAGKEEALKRKKKWLKHNYEYYCALRPSKNVQHERILRNDFHW